MVFMSKKCGFKCGQPVPQPFAECCFGLLILSSSDTFVRICLAVNSIYFHANLPFVVYFTFYCSLLSFLTLQSQISLNTCLYSLTHVLILYSLNTQSVNSNEPFPVTKTADLEITNDFRVAKFSGQF